MSAPFFVKWAAIARRERWRINAPFVQKGAAAAGRGGCRL